MAPFVNSLRLIWPRNQAPAPPRPTKIANLDGVSDGETSNQLNHEAAFGQHLNKSLPIGNEFVPSIVGQHQAARDEGGHHTSIPQQRGEHLPTHQEGFREDEADRFREVLQELPKDEQDQYESMSPQQPARSTTRPSPKMSSQHALMDDRISNYSSPYTSEGLSVKTEPSVEEDDIFAEFTNEDFHDDDAHISVNSQQASNDTYEVVKQTVPFNPSIKQVPGLGKQDSNDTDDRAGKVEATTATHGGEEAPELRPDQQSNLTSKEHISPSLFMSTVGSDMAKQPFSREQHLSTIAQPTVRLQAPLSEDTNQRSPSADSVLGSQRHSSEETVLSHGGLELSANSHLLAQQWKQRHQLSNMSTLKGAAEYAHQSLPHGPVSVQQHRYPSMQQPVTERPFAQQTLKLNHNAQALSGQPRATNQQYSKNMQYQTYLADGKYNQDFSCQMHSRTQSGGPHAPGMQTRYPPRPSFPPTQAYPHHRLINPEQNMDVQMVEISEASDDEEPLATRAPRHRSIAGSRDSRPHFDASVPADAYQREGPSSQNAHLPATAEKSSSTGKADSVIEPSDKDEDEPISWTLPKHEVTYHPPLTATDLPSAKVSIPNLVREQIYLSSDHAEQEMDLFLSVFLPTHRALQTPDPQPAHAVLNFHTIAVMVLEAFVQYEIGDEMGRGYGFHGGNEARRPSSSPSSNSPVRTRDATDASVDDIFFAVVDRWRAGLEAGSEVLRMIRGCQEFCDVALDVIHHVKEHGLLRSVVPARKRKERSDKGVARGAGRGAGVKSSKEAKPGVGTKRGNGLEAVPASAKRKADAATGRAPAGKVTLVESRKKAKVEVKKGKPKTDAKKAKPKVSSSGITIVDARKK
ncbi:hypothetical protein EJ07DRAFT_152420 [Lizonia empirigonia]|nr:hypothetical protein EJ07DRAFT_152420 [Lizonia empirigonia]